jgi:hypothetical protein
MDIFVESDFGLQLSGILDPKEDNNNKIEAFLKLIVIAILFD